MWFWYSYRKMVELFANSGDPDQMPCSAASDLGLHCLPKTLSGVSTLKSVKHYKNTPIQIYWKFYNQKGENFQIKKSDIFHIPAQNIDYGYLLEPPRQGGSNEYPQSMYF